MPILDELMDAARLKLPSPTTDEFWESLVRTLADESIVGDKAWLSLSDIAQDWANDGSRAVKARNAKARAEKRGSKWKGDDSALEIPPLPVAGYSGPREPRDRSKARTSKRASKKSAKRKLGRPAAFRAGNCYWFIRHMISEVSKFEECDPDYLLERFGEHGVRLKSSSANMMMYDTITVLRVMRDLGLYSHPLVSGFARVDE